MRTKIRRVIAISIVTLCLLLLFACVVSSNPLSPAKMEKRLQGYFDDFVTVRDYLLGLDHGSAYIHLEEDYTHYFADHDDHTISDETVLASLKRLRSIRCSLISAVISENSVSFTLWYRGADASCGVLYRIDKDREVTPQFLTELHETADEDWFTYIADYNEWRKQHK